MSTIEINQKRLKKYTKVDQVFYRTGLCELLLTLSGATK